MKICKKCGLLVTNERFDLCFWCFIAFPMVIK